MDKIGEEYPTEGEPFLESLCDPQEHRARQFSILILIRRAAYISVFLAYSALLIGLPQHLGNSDAKCASRLSAWCEFRASVDKLEHIR
jgi:hypothetical protein